VSSTDFDRTVTLPEDTNVSTHGLVMQSAGVIAGTVTDAAGGEPLYGARLTAGRVVSDRLPRAWTDFEGNYRLIGVTPGRTPVTVHFADHAPQIAEVQVVAGEEVKLDFALAAGRVIIGQVVDAEGQPVPRVHIMATRWAGHETLGLQAMTDGAGRFIIADAPRDEFEICLYAPGYKPLLDQIVSPQQKEYAFALKPDARKAPGIEGTGPAVGSEAPTFTLTTLDGKPLDLAGLKGKVVLLDFWATWCAPCVTEIPNLAAVQQAFGTRGDFVMLSISIEEDAARVRSFTEGRKMSWPQATAADRGAADAVERYEVNAIPALYIIDREGRIAARDVRGTAIVDTVRNVLGNE
jgi:thiol-disulfide isomerase/thioredoxin